MRQDGAALDVWGDEWDAVADVIVVGSGAAGLAAALGAAKSGAKVMVLDGAQHPGGTTAKSSGMMWIPNNSVMARFGLSDDRDAALQFMSRGAYPTLYSPDSPCFGLPADKYALLAVLYDDGGRVFDELVGLDAVPFDDAVGHSYPDYYATFGEDKAPIGRAIAIKLPEGHRRGIDATGGQILIDAMLASCGKLCVEVKLDTRVVAIVRDQTNLIVGLEVHVGNGTQLLGVRRGVVFATGGFLHDEALCGAYLRGPVLGGAASHTAKGDFVRIGIEAGAAFDHMSQAWWSEVVVEMALRNRATPHDCVYAFGDSMVIVNRFGHRVMNEKMAYNDRGQVHHVWDSSHLEYSNYLLFMLFDDTVMNDTRPTARPRYPIPLPEEGRENIISAPSLRELGAAIDARLAEIASQTGLVRLSRDFDVQLAATIDRFNSMAAKGVDDDFGRGESPIERAWAGPPRPEYPNPTMRPFDVAGPYHCMILGPGALDTKGGPVIDARSHVVGVRGNVIPRLFAAGNCAAAPTGQGYYGPGGTLGPAITFGFIAGESAASEDDEIPRF
jgi:3-oxosteroid 1-dehydrogenase